MRSSEYPVQNSYVLINKIPNELCKIVSEYHGNPTVETKNYWMGIIFNPMRICTAGFMYSLLRVNSNNPRDRSAGMLGLYMANIIYDYKEYLTFLISMVPRSYLVELKKVKNYILRKSIFKKYSEQK